MTPPNNKLNFGLVNNQSRLGSIGLATFENFTKIFDTPDWLKYAPQMEIQKSDLVDFMDCVSEGATNAIHVTLNCLYGIDILWSVRYLAKMSGTTPEGNTEENVIASINSNGMVAEQDWPRDRTMSWDTYYSSVFSEIIALGKKWPPQWDYKEYPVQKNPKVMMEGLKYGVYAVTGFAWTQNGQGLYIDAGQTPNHKFLVVGYVENQYWIVYDSYPIDFQIDDNASIQEFEKHLDWNYDFGMVDLIQVKRKATQLNWLDYIVDFFKLIINKVSMIFKEVIHDTHGGYWFVKDGQRQQINSVGGILTVLFRQFGVLKDNVQDADLNKIPVTTKFFN